MSARIVNLTNPVQTQLLDSAQGAVSTIAKMIETTLEDGGEVRVTLHNNEGELLGEYAVEVG